jgi:hypothetical protein
MKNATPALVLLAYALGVLNERTFPGDHWWPAPGEWKFWAIGAVLLFVSVLVDRARRK